ncbi:MAG: ABC-F family ATP-binding cassette domain-containing protein, partial [Clostridia bacterium]|nr:ABC-F family ATP-binding cassette domain-containing protein [Clostridia bacterium]
ISYVSQSTENLKGNLKIFAQDNKIDESIFKAMLSKMGFSKLDFDMDMLNMSEGQKKKVLIAKSISERANIYIWDEPLNYIDIITRIQIEDAILNYTPTLIFVEHDETFIKKVATKIIKLEKNRDK